jgi:hypothetical protein
VRFATEGLAIYARKTRSSIPINEKTLWMSICRQVHAIAGLPRVESEFSESWSREAKLVLPSSDTPLHASAIWGPVLAYVVIGRMAESVAGKDIAGSALALFDRLRLREPLARAFSGGGDITEDGWRAAARVRLAFLIQTLTPAKTVKAAATDEVFAGWPRGLWDDDDARWLLKVHEAGGEWYFNKELHQQILWWTQLPDLLQLPVLTDKKLKPAVRTIEETVQEACEQAEEAGYRIGKRKGVTAKPANREKGALAK